jgi:hypothetical protein
MSYRAGLAVSKGSTPVPPPALIYVISVFGHKRMAVFFLLCVDYLRAISAAAAWIR